MDSVFQKGYAAAKAAGLSDEKILTDLSRNPVYGPMIKQAGEMGMSKGALLSGLQSGQLAKMASPEVEQRTRLEGIGRGMEDVASGVTSLTSLLPGSFGDEYTQESADRSAVYDRANKDIGFDGARVGGQVAALAPLMFAGPTATATVGKRIAGNAALGAVGGFIPRDGLGNRLTNAAFGAALGAALPEGVRAGVKQAAKGVRSAMSRMTNVEPAVQAAVRASGATSPSDDVGKYLGTLATQQLRATGKIDQAALDRAAKVMAVNPALRPTLGQITRNPAIYSAEKNLVKSGTEAGDMIAGRMQEQESLLRQSASRMVDDTGGEPLTDYAYGGKAGGVLRDKWKAMQAEVGSLYDEAAKGGGDNIAMTPDELIGMFKSDKLQSLAAGDASVDHTVNSLIGRIKELGLADEAGRPVRPMTMADANDLRRFVGGIQTSNPSIMALQKNVIGYIDDVAGAKPGFEPYRAARDAARARFGEFSDRTLDRIRTNQVPDEKLFDLATSRNVDTAKDFAGALTSGTPEQLAAGQGVLKDTQRKLIAQVLAKGQRGPAGEEAFYPASLRNALNPDLNGYQPEVLDALLTPGQSGGLRQFSEVVDILRADPAHNSINQSGSGALMAGLVQGGEGALVRRLGGGSDLAGGVAGAAVKAIIGGSKEAQQEAMAKALLSGNPAAIPGIDSAALNALLTPDNAKQALLIRALMQGPGMTGTAAMTGNQ